MDAPDIDYLNNRPLWKHPQYIGGSPNNLALVRKPTTVLERAPSEVFVTEPHRYASITEVAIYASNTYYVKFLDAPVGKRNMLMFRNADLAGVCYIGFNAVPSNVSTFAVQPGQLIVLDTVVPQDDLYVIADIAQCVFCYAWSTFIAAG